MNRFAALRLSLPGHSMGNSAGAIGPSLSLRSGSSLSQRSGGVSPFTPGVIPGGPLSSPLSALSLPAALFEDASPAAPAAVEKARFAFLSDVLAAEKEPDTEKTAGLITSLGTKFDRTEIAQIQDVFAEYNDFDIVWPYDSPYDSPDSPYDSPYDSRTSVQ